MIHNHIYSIYYKYEDMYSTVCVSLTQPYPSELVIVAEQLDLLQKFIEGYTIENFSFSNFSNFNILFPNLY